MFIWVLPGQLSASSFPALPFVPVQYFTHPSSRRMNRNSLPEEILVEIIIYACTDAATTACTLREVSSHAKALVEPYRFRNIAIYGEARLSLLSDQLSTWAIDEDGTRRTEREIHHLLISTHHSSDGNAGTWHLHDLWDHFVRWASGTHSPKRPHCHTTPKPTFHSSLTQITRLCAPHLVTYSVFMECHHDNTSDQWIASTVYPHLRSISVQYRNSEHLREASATVKPTLPALQRLCVDVDSCFSSPGPLWHIAENGRLIQRISYCGPPDSFILDYALNRYKGKSSPDFVACSELEMRFLVNATTNLLCPDRSVAAAALLRKLAEVDPTLRIL